MKKQFVHIEWNPIYSASGHLWMHWEKWPVALLSIYSEALIGVGTTLTLTSPGELRVNWVPAAITWFNDIECQCSLNQHMNEHRGIVFWEDGIMACDVIIKWPGYGV